MIKIAELLQIFKDRLGLKSDQIEVYISDGSLKSSAGKLNSGFILEKTVNLIISETDIALEILAYLIGNFFTKHYPNRPPVVKFAADQLNKKQVDFHFLITLEEIYTVKKEGEILHITAAPLPDLYDILQRDKNVDYNYKNRPPAPS